MSSDIKDLNFKTLRVANKLRAEAWHGDPADSEPWTTADRITELSGEAGELAEAIVDCVLALRFQGHVGAIANIAKKLRRIECGMRGNDPSQLPDLHKAMEDEFGDAVICLDLLAMQLDIDLGACTRNKFNKTSDKVGLSAYKL